MPTYFCIIKSHCDAPDFELYIDAINRQEAINKIAINYEIDKKVIDEHLSEEERIKPIKIKKPKLLKNKCKNSDHWSNLIFFGECPSCKVNLSDN